MAPRFMLIRKLLLLALAGGLGSAVLAQNLDMQGTGGAANDGRPTSGTTQASVEATYGAPVTKIAPVGDPPIARWEYTQFIVYFEHDRVIHAVRRR